MKEFALDKDQSTGMREIFYVGRTFPNFKKCISLDNTGCESGDSGSCPRFAPFVCDRVGLRHPDRVIEFSLSSTVRAQRAFPTHGHRPPSRAPPWTIRVVHTAGMRSYSLTPRDRRAARGLSQSEGAGAHMQTARAPHPRLSRMWGVTF